jgi:hypothetical protein
VALKPEAVQQILASLKRRADYEFVMGRLSSAEWIDPLKAAGLFKDPPAPIKSGDSISFPSWPESAFLARVAGQAPTLVADTILAFRETDNPRIHEDIVDAALSMPCADAVRIAKREIEWIKSQPYLYLMLPARLTKLIEYLVNCGERQVSLNLARVLFAVFPDSRHSGPSLHSEARGRIDSWDYGQQLDAAVDRLSLAFGRETLSLLSDLLEEVIRLRRPAGTESGEDYSFIWQRELTEKHAHENGIDHSIVLATTRVAIGETRRHGVDVGDLIDSLERRPFTVFKRIALLCLSRAPDSALGHGRERVLDTTLFDNPAVLNEYAQLSQRWFGGMEATEQAKVLTWIERGRDREKIRVRYEENGVEVSDADLDRWDDQWRRDRLAPIAAQLPSDWHDRFDSLVDRYGAPAFDRHVSSEVVFSWGEPSPKSIDDLRTMAVEDIAALLESWVPPVESAAHNSPTSGGLARTVGEFVKERPLDFTTHFARFKSVPRFYIARILDAIRESVRSGQSINWKVTLSVAQNLLRGDGGAVTELGSESSQSIDLWIKRDIAALIQEGLESAAGGFGIELREEVWALLTELVEDENPSADQEKELDDLPMDPLTVSMNTVRGQALHAIVQYAMWLRDQSADSTSESKFSEFTSVVLAVLDRHLDLSTDSAISVRAVYGQAFPRLMVIDGEWARGNSASIFPEQSELREYWDAAWESFLRYNHFHPIVFDALRAQYRFALGAMDLTSDHGERYGAEVALAQHMMVAMWQGKITIDEQDGLLERLFSVASASLRGAALKFVGSSISRSSEQPPTGVLTRIQSLWIKRRAAAASSRDASAFEDELTSFGWWVGADCLDAAWRLANLEWTLRTFGHVQAEAIVLESLGDLAKFDPLGAIRCARLLILGSERVLYLASHAGLRAIADEIHRGGHEESLIELDHLANELGAQSFFHARSLLSPSPAIDPP